MQYKGFVEVPAGESPPAELLKQNPRGSDVKAPLSLRHWVPIPLEIDDAVVEKYADRVLFISTDDALQRYLARQFPCSEAGATRVWRFTHTFRLKRPYSRYTLSVARRPVVAISPLPLFPKRMVFSSAHETLPQEFGVADPLSHRDVDELRERGFGVSYRNNMWVLTTGKAEQRLKRRAYVRRARQRKKQSDDIISFYDACSTPRVLLNIVHHALELALADCCQEHYRDFAVVVATHVELYAVCNDEQSQLTQQWAEFEAASAWESLYALYTLYHKAMQRKKLRQKLIEQLAELSKDHQGDFWRLRTLFSYTPHLCNSPNAAVKLQGQILQYFQQLLKKYSGREFSLDNLSEHVAAYVRSPPVPITEFPHKPTQSVIIKWLAQREKEQRKKQCPTQATSS